MDMKLQQATKGYEEIFKLKEKPMSDCVERKSLSRK
jgi:hypothetical protein